MLPHTHSTPPCDYELQIIAKTRLIKVLKTIKNHNIRQMVAQVLQNVM